MFQDLPQLSAKVCLVPRGVVGLFVVIFTESDTHVALSNHCFYFLIDSRPVYNLSCPSSALFYAHVTNMDLT